ncbi:MAG: hypothetical protein ACYTFY_15430 [Planctomycetota bacterium]
MKTPLLTAVLFFAAAYLTNTIYAEDTSPIFDRGGVNSIKIIHANKRNLHPVDLDAAVFPQPAYFLDALYCKPERQTTIRSIDRTCHAAGS